MTEQEARPGYDRRGVDEQVDRRTRLLPEERAAGSDDPHVHQAGAILAESEVRTEHPDPSSTAGWRSSADTV
jgi:hypothetical protein